MPVLAPGVRNQTHLDDLADFSGTIGGAGGAKLVLNQQPRRLSLFVANLSAADTITLGLGPATATSTIAAGAVTGIAVVNSGIGYTVAPQVVIAGGIIAGDLQQAPQHPAAAHATIAGGSVSAITVDDPGSGYLVAPYIYLMNPLPGLGGGAKTPSATVGIPLPPGWSFSTSGMIAVPTSALAIFGPNAADAYEVKVGGLL